jgi:hypothetical protein
LLSSEFVRQTSLVDHYPLSMNHEFGLKYIPTHSNFFEVNFILNCYRVILYYDLLME